MSVETLSLTEARERLLALAERLSREPEATVQVTKRGKRVLTLLSAEAYDAIVETLEILSDEKAMSSLRTALREVAEGRSVPWAVARRKILR